MEKEKKRGKSLLEENIADVPIPADALKKIVNGGQREKVTIQ